MDLLLKDKINLLTINLFVNEAKKEPWDKYDWRIEDAKCQLGVDEEMFLENNDYQQLLRNYLEQADRFNDLCEYETAIEYLDKAEKLSINVLKKDWLGDIYETKGLSLYDFEKFEEAIKYLEKAKRIFKDNGCQIYTIYANQALVYRNWGKFEKSIILFKKAENICLKLVKKNSKSLKINDINEFKDNDECSRKKKTLHQLYREHADLLFICGMLDESLIMRKKEAALSIELDEVQDLAYCYFRWGLLARELNDEITESKKLYTALIFFRSLDMRWAEKIVLKEIKNMHDRIHSCILRDKSIKAF